MTPTGAWEVGVSLEGRGPVDPAHIRLRVNRVPASEPGLATISALRNNVIDVILDERALGLGGAAEGPLVVDGVRFTPR